MLSVRTHHTHACSHTHAGSALNLQNESELRSRAHVAFPARAGDTEDVLGTGRVAVRSPPPAEYSGSPDRHEPGHLDPGDSRCAGADPGRGEARGAEVEGAAPQP